MITRDQFEQLAMAIYWAAYTGNYGPHRTGDVAKPVVTLDRAKAWAMTSEPQREFCRHQALSVIAELMQMGKTL